LKFKFEIMFSALYCWFLANKDMIRGQEQNVASLVCFDYLTSLAQVYHIFICKESCYSVGKVYFEIDNNNLFLGIFPDCSFLHYMEHSF
jgi:hypothetical protein